MGNVDFQSGDGEKGYQQVTVVSSTIKSAKANRVIVAVAASAILALSGASATQLANYSGTTYNGNAGACATSYEIASVGDPHIETDFGGQVAQTSLGTADDSNFSTVYNTSGGESTVTTSVQGSAIGTQGLFNTAAGMKHAGANGFSLQLQTWGNYILNGESDTPDYNKDYSTPVLVNGGIHATLTDAQGNAVAIPHTFADGSAISSPDGGITYVVTQPLNGGGNVTTSYAFSSDDSEPQINVLQSATGAALVSGDAVGLATGNDSPILAMPCSGIDYNNGGGFVPTPAPGDVAAGNATPAPAANPPASQAANPPANNAPAANPPAAATVQPAPPPTPQPTVAPAQDTSGNAAEESL